jgi:hypothetical protein
MGRTPVADSITGHGLEGVWLRIILVTLSSLHGAGSAPGPQSKDFILEQADGDLFLPHLQLTDDTGLLSETGFVEPFGLSFVRCCNKSFYSSDFPLFALGQHSIHQHLNLTRIRIRYGYIRYSSVVA